MNTTNVFDAACNELREDLKALYPKMKALLVTANESTPTASAEGETVDETIAEMAANVEIAMRHLEDVSMRVGKAIQANNGGKSPFEGTMGTGTLAAVEKAADTSASDGEDATASTETTAAAEGGSQEASSTEAAA